LSNGELVYDLPPLEQIRERRANDIGRLHLGVKRMMNPHIYHVSLSGSLWQLKEELIAGARQAEPAALTVL
jgi:nicotinate phosphoribosyltransferase